MYCVAAAVQVEKRLHWNEWNGSVRLCSVASVQHLKVICSSSRNRERERERMGKKFERRRNVLSVDACFETRNVCEFCTVFYGTRSLWRSRVGRGR